MWVSGVECMGKNKVKEVISGHSKGVLNAKPEALVFTLKAIWSS